MHKRLVAGVSRLVTCLQSNFIGTNFAGFCSNLGVCGLFSSPFVSYWVHIDWPAPGYLMGAGNPTISRETETQVPAACQPQPRQPHSPHCCRGMHWAKECKSKFYIWRTTYLGKLQAGDPPPRSPSSKTRDKFHLFPQTLNIRQCCNPYASLKCLSPLSSSSPL